MKWLVVLLAACDPIWEITVDVKDDTGAPLAGAALALTNCPEQNVKNVADVAVVTDDTGIAGLANLGFSYPPCDITVGKPGFQPFESSFDALCNGDLGNCERVQTIDVVLSPDP